jgi:hypothetical protein
MSDMGSLPCVTLLSAPHQPYRPIPLQPEKHSGRSAHGILAAKVPGHSRVETTMRYDRRDERAKRKAQAQIDLPI